MLSPISRLMSIRGISTSKALAMSGAPGAAHGDSGWKLWRNLTFFVAIPAVILGNVNAFMPRSDGVDPHARPPFVKYEYLRLRSKKFPWGDGNHSLFHNGHLNALPDGYEDDGHDGGHH